MSNTTVDRQGGGRQIARKEGGWREQGEGGGWSKGVVGREGGREGGAGGRAGGREGGREGGWYYARQAESVSGGREG